MERHNSAQDNADYIIENFNKDVVLDEFPIEFFERGQIQVIVNDINSKCDWKNREGKFVDFFTILNNGKNNTGFIYEYFLDCDSLRFVLIYDMDKKEPQLFNFQLQPIEEHFPYIVDPSKQLQIE